MSSLTGKEPSKGKFGIDLVVKPAPKAIVVVDKSPVPIKKAVVQPQPSNIKSFSKLPDQPSQRKTSAKPAASKVAAPVAVSINNPSGVFSKYAPLPSPAIPKKTDVKPKEGPQKAVAIKVAPPPKPPQANPVPAVGIKPKPALLPKKVEKPPVEVAKPIKPVPATSLKPQTSDKDRNKVAKPEPKQVVVKKDSKPAVASKPKDAPESKPAKPASKQVDQKPSKPAAKPIESAKPKAPSGTVSLAEAFLSILSALEPFTELAQNQEVGELVEGSANSQVAQKFLAFVNKKTTAKVVSELLKNKTDTNDCIYILLFELMSGVRIPQFNAHSEPASSDLSIDELRKKFDNGWSSISDSVGENSSSALLKKLLSAAKNSPDQVKNFENYLRHLSLDRHSDNAEIDELAERLIGEYRTLLEREYKDIISKGWINSKILAKHSLTHEQTVIPASYSNFSIIPNLSVGFWEIKADILAAMNSKPIVFCLPDRKRYKLNLVKTLNSLDPGYKTDVKGIFSNYPFPTPTNSVSMISRLVCDADKDFDWVHVSFNPAESTIDWLLADQGRKTEYYVQFDRSNLHAFKAGGKDLRKCIKMPIFTSKKSLKSLRLGIETMELALFDTKDTADTLLSYLKELLGADVTFADFVITRLDLQSEVKISSGSKKLIDIIGSVGWTEDKTNTKQQIPYACTFINSKLSTELEDMLASNLTTVKATDKSAITKGGKDLVIKSSLNDFLDHMFKFVTPDQVQVASKNLGILQSGESIEKWLPNTLVVDVSQLSFQIIDPKKDLTLNLFVEDLEASGLQLSNKYRLRGVITKIQDGYSHSRIEGDTCYGADGKTCKLASILDHTITHVVFTRNVQTLN